MRTKRYLHILLFTLSWIINFTVSAQNKVRSPQIKYIKEAEDFFYKDLDESEKYYLLAEKEAEKQKDKRIALLAKTGLAKIMNRKGNLEKADSLFQILLSQKKYLPIENQKSMDWEYAYMLFRSNKLEEAMEKFSILNEYYEKNNNDDLLVKTYNIQAKIYIKQNDYEQAMKLLLHSRDVAEKKDYKDELSLIYNSIARLFYRRGEFHKAIDNFKKGANIQQELNTLHLLCSSYQNIGTVYLQLKEIDKGIDYINRSIPIFQQIGDKKGYMSAMNNLAVIYNLNAEYDKAIKIHQSIIEEAKLLNNFREQANAQLNISQIYFDKKQYKQAKKLCLKAIKDAENFGLTDMTLFYKIMIKCCDKLKQYKEEIDWQKRYHDAKITLLNQENFNKALDLEKKYETKKKELKIKEITLENKNKALIIQKNRILFYATTLILLIFIILGSLVLRENRKKLKSYAIIIEKSKKVFAQNQIERDAQFEKRRVVSEIPDNVIKPILERLKIQINHKKIYTDPELSLNTLAHILDTNSRYLSLVIHETFQSNYTTFINELRVEEAQKLLCKNPELTIEAIGEMSGFNSKSTFNMAFKKITGMTPSSYQKNHLLMDMAI
ncbi:AraC family transcriptional regulator [Halosquirtibacter laminarini]|uniref:AraC family transcriptional regulator n=1 Tax=Halosquirtibacter laminarini TaxID=3374600 RepID=A0AC61NQS9_9BACT|nr:AraC family transcriptional regulator [Prolixibacteraceae bacterium]